MIIKFIKNHFFKFIIFSFVGFGAFIIDWMFFNLFYFIGLGFVISISFAWLVSVIFNFTINRNFTFSARGFCIKKQFIKWAIIYFIAFLARLGVGNLVLFILGNGTLNANIAYLSGIIISIPISFLGSLLWVFNKK
jgi:putative flippase GtrA